MPSGPALPPLSTRLGAAPSCSFEAPHATRGAGRVNSRTPLEPARAGSPDQKQSLSMGSPQMPRQYQNLRIAIPSAAGSYTHPNASVQCSEQKVAPAQGEGEHRQQQAHVQESSRKELATGEDTGQSLQSRPVLFSSNLVRRAQSSPNLVELGDGPGDERPIAKPGALGRSLSSNVRYIVTPPPFLPVQKPASCCSCHHCHSHVRQASSQLPSPASTLEYPASPQDQDTYSDWSSSRFESASATWPSMQSLSSISSWDQGSVVSSEVSSFDTPGSRPSSSESNGWPQMEGLRTPGTTVVNLVTSTSYGSGLGTSHQGEPRAHYTSSLPPRPPRPSSPDRFRRGSARRQTYPATPLPRSDSELHHWLEASRESSNLSAMSGSGPVLQPLTRKQKLPTLEFAFVLPGSASKSKPVRNPQGGERKGSWCWRCGGRGDLSAWCVICGGEFAACKKCKRMREAHGRRGDTCLCGGCMSKPLPVSKTLPGPRAASVV